MRSVGDAFDLRQVSAAKRVHIALDLLDIPVPPLDLEQIVDQLRKLIAPIAA